MRNKISIQFLVFFITVLFLAGVSGAATFVVDTPGGFRQALDTASHNGEEDVIWVKSGIYNITSTLSYTTENGDGSLHIWAQNMDDKPIFDGGGAVQIMDIDNDSDGNGDNKNDTIDIRGIVFQNGCAAPGSASGLALRINTSQAGIAVIGCVFKNNTVATQSSYTQSTIGTEGGQVSALLAYSTSGGILVTNSVFDRNTGGAGLDTTLVTETGKVFLTNNTFYNETGSWYSVFLFNRAEVYKGCIFYLYNNIFYEIGASADQPSPMILIDLRSGAPDNSVLIHNNCFRNSIPLVLSVSPSLANNLWRTDPLLVNPDSDDFHLQAGSPCIDAGDNAAPGLLVTDFEGDKRILDGNDDGVDTVDIGADEFEDESGTMYSLSVTITGTGRGRVTGKGIDCGTDCQESYDQGDTVTLTAHPEGGSYFAGWGDGCASCGTNLICVIEMNSDLGCRARFDDDNDGVPGTVEDGAPNGGDGNGDGIQDKFQNNVTSLPTATGSTYLTIVTNGSCEQNLRVRSVLENPNDPNYWYPFGLLSFDLPCSKATVKIYYHGTESLDGYVYRKYGPSTPGDPSTKTWYTLPGVTFGSEIIGGKKVAFAQFILGDGEQGDDTGKDGTIVDQGGPGRPGGAPSVQVPVYNGWGIAVCVLVMGAVAIYGRRRMPI